MANKLTRKKNRLIKLLYFVFISLVMITLAIIEISSNHVSFSDEKALTRYIKSEEELLDGVAGAYNDTLILDNDITITKDFSLGTKINPFKGVFDGNGYTIKLEETNASLFDYISESGIVKDLKIEFSHPNIDSEVYSILAKENNGTIENIQLVCKNTYLSNVSQFGLLVNTNNGVIRNCVIDYKLEKNKVTTDESIKTYIGGVCIYNNNLIENIIAKVEFVGYDETDGVKVSESLGTLVNNNIGAIVVNKTKGTVKNCYVEGNENLYTCDKVILSNKDIKIDFISSIKDQFALESGQTLFYDEMKFNPELWMLANGVISLIHGDTR